MDPIHCGAGILMRCSSGSTAKPIIYGVPLTMKAKCLRSMPRNGGTAKPRLGIVRLNGLDLQNLQLRTFMLQVAAIRPGRRLGLV